ncbi:hypothetical protein [Sulfurimonas sp. ST-27]|uniref:hypothetical protein n=1 Tax=Sulfurimonas sp. ST-27 TaxID=3400152 RepID=UPI003AB69F75
MSKFKREFTLKQHTPIIHFQSEQNGATLRATELKPKFDRFLLENVKGLPYIKNINGHKSLDYKVNIEPNLASSKKIEKGSLFFGNIGDGKEKEYKEYTKPFKIVFLSFLPEILDAIDNNFEAFLANTNFGTRQSKGYGSFYLANKKFNQDLVLEKVYTFSSKDWEKNVGLFYQFLRQGINLSMRPSSPFYTKPIIFAYAKSKGWQWEKKSIKEKFFANKLQEQQNKHQSDVLLFSSDKKLLLRDLFGLSSSQEWKSYNVTIEKEHQDIERFQSPITFKIADERVYFWADKNVQKLLDQEFTIKVKRKGDLKLSTPKSFSFDDFFAFAFRLNLETYIESKYHKANEYAVLKKIFNEIKAGL